MSPFRRVKASEVVRQLQDLIDAWGDQPIVVKYSGATRVPVAVDCAYFSSNGPDTIVVSFEYLKKGK